ncbi:DUF2300 domain-containing protein [Pseudaeromonas sharmana]|uniref:DUF2300 domain-containing protein n=1 Tax=Pseudaeromonas sharmana TaxID=328412 RepID=A0ABV8CSA6_9GAMM
MCRYRLLAMLLLCPPLQGYAADRLVLASGDGEYQAWQWPDNQAAEASRWQTPLGSVWKLFVYAYLVETQQREPLLQCTGEHPEQERYCCEPQERIDRDTALSRSCGLYFTPARLRLDAEAWRRHWQQRSAPDWLGTLSALDERQLVGVDELLHQLEQFPLAVIQQAQAALVGTSLQGRGRDALPTLGTLAIVKTFTMPTPDGTLGGGAGWSQDGHALWFAGRGNSQQVMSRLAPRLAHTLLDTPVRDNSCVRVRFFARYPLLKIVNAHGSALALHKQPLQGHYRLYFKNGQQLDWQTAEHRFWLQAGADQPAEIWGRLNETEYVARVVDREAQAEASQAAKALAIAARSYLHQQARFDGECLQIDDSSARQRVSAQPATAAALAASRTTAGLMLRNTPVQYHLHRAGSNQLSWQQALEWQSQGLDFVQILARAYPDAQLSWQGSASAQECQPLSEPSRWLRQQLPKWQAVLQTTEGFEAIALPQICLLQHGRPYADQKAQRIYLRPATSLESRITLVHEYLHLALAHHPAGADETYIEQLARELVRGEL